MVHTTAEDRWLLSAERLRELCAADPGRPRMVVLNYPANPHGATYSAAELKDIARVAREFDLILLSDEIYGKLHHTGEHVSVARYYPEGTILSSGLSKWCGAGGWRLGTFAFPESLEWLIDAMTTLASETYTSTSAPIQYAAVRAFEGGEEIEHYLAHTRRMLATLSRWCSARLREAGANVVEPDGAFYVFPDFGPLRERLAARGILNSADLGERALEEIGIAFVPGVEFGRPPGELTARLAYVNFDGAAALAASQAVPLGQPLDERFLRVHCFRTTQAIEALCEWVQR